jgi:hypothetical protein
MTAETAMNNVSSLMLRTDFIAKPVAFHPLKRPGYPGILERVLNSSRALGFGKFQPENST